MMRMSASLVRMGHARAGGGASSCASAATNVSKRSLLQRFKSGRARRMFRVAGGKPRLDLTQMPDLLVKKLVELLGERRAPSASL